MSTATLDPTDATITPDPTPPGSGPSRRARLVRLARYVGTPVALAGICYALYAWVTATPLSSQESRLLNRHRLIEEVVRHINLSAVAVVLVLVIAIPLGVLLTRPWARRFRPAALAVANAGQAIPSLGVVVLGAVAFGLLGFRAAVGAVVFYSILPVLRNTMVGLEQVDASVIDAARGMGMSKFRVLRKVEMPLAVPVMAAGVRTALVIVVGTMALATFINAGGLGDYINNGLKLRNTKVLYTGSVLTAVLALAVDWLGGILEDVLRPKGL